jgi:hypothetical protein
MSNNKNKNKQRVEYKTLLSVLANGSPDNARQLLKKHSGQDATDSKDLEVKLARVYALSPIKYEIEKEFAEIHPHKDFILKYLAPKPKETPISEQPLQPEVFNKDNDSSKSVVDTKIVSDTYTGFNGHPPCGNPNCPYCRRYMQSSSCEGNPNCGCNKMSNACGCGGSNFNGYSNAEGGNQNQKPQDYVGLIGMIAVVGITFFVLSKTVK